MNGRSHRYGHSTVTSQAYSCSLRRKRTLKTSVTVDAAELTQVCTESLLYVSIPFSFGCNYSVIFQFTEVADKVMYLIQ